MKFNKYLNRRLITASHPDIETRRSRKRAAFNRAFAEITFHYGGESRKQRRAMAWAKAQRVAKGERAHA